MMNAKLRVLDIEGFHPKGWDEKGGQIGISCISLHLFGSFLVSLHNYFAAAHRWSSPKRTEGNVVIWRERLYKYKYPEPHFVIHRCNKQGNVPLLLQTVSLLLTLLLSHNSCFVRYCTHMRTHWLCPPLHKKKKINNKTCKKHHPN
jgi:hypothetical protein